MTVGFVINPRHVRHAVEWHPEAPQRLKAVLALLEECGLLPSAGSGQAANPGDGLRPRHSPSGRIREQGHPPPLRVRLLHDQASSTQEGGRQGV